jgi:hypothetical protein
MDKQLGKKSRLLKKLTNLRNSLPALIVESLLITFGVLLAFAVDSWKSERKLHSDTIVVLQNMRQELISNRGVVLEWLGYHDSLQVRILNLIEGDPRAQPFELSDKNSLERLYPEPSISYLLQKTAWQTAHSAQVIRQFQYRTTYNLTHCYEYQYKVDGTLRLLFDRINDTPGNDDDMKQRLKRILNLLDELSEQEVYLLGVYRDALIEVDKELISFSN